MLSIVFLIWDIVLCNVGYLPNIFLIFVFLFYTATKPGESFNAELVKVDALAQISDGAVPVSTCLFVISI